MSLILLELTYKEAEVLKAALIKERYSWEEEEVLRDSPSLSEKSIKVCNSVWSKLDQASQPQSEVLITNKDLFDIVSKAKCQYQLLPSELHISNVKMEEKDFVHI